MLPYANGRYPLGLFVHRGGDIYLTPSLNARWNEAVRLAIQKYGVRLYITGPSDRGWDGANGYRWFERQVTYKNAFGQWAASPGTSSHGGKWKSLEVFALDVQNWSALAPGNRSLAWARFVSLMKAVGLTTDFVSPREEWHVGDFNNAWKIPSFGVITVNPNTTNKPSGSSQEEEEMKGATYTRSADKADVYILFNEVSGFFVEHTGVPSDYNNTIARLWGTGSWPRITEGHARVIKAALAEVRAAR